MNSMQTYNALWMASTRMTCCSCSDYFNARVGKSERCVSGSHWVGMRGYCGVGTIIESGEALLTFCALNELHVVTMNTTFE